MSGARRARLLAGLAGLAIGAFGTGYLLRGEAGGTPAKASAPDVRPRTTTPADTPVIARSASAMASANATSSTAAASPDVPLPPHDTPLAGVLDELESRARRGDRKAACRLAMDGNFCRLNPLDQDSVAFFERAIARRPRTTPSDVAWIERLERVQQRAVRVCTGLPASWAQANAWRYTLQGAQAGDDLLAAQYAIAPPLDHDDFLENPEPWQHYRANAAPLLLRAAADGQIHAIWQLQRIYAGSHHLRGMPRAIAPDPRLAAVYAVALVPATAGDSRREFERAIAEARVRFADQEWQAIEREGMALASEHFADREPFDFQTGVFGNEDSRSCE